jgi:hypothetical protein
MPEAKKQTDLEQAKQRLAAAQTAVEKAADAVESARADAIDAALKLRDLDHCLAAGVIDREDADLLAAREAAASTTGNLMRARSLQEMAQRELADYTDLIPRLESEVARDKAIETIRRSKPELLAEVEDAQAEAAALATREDERGGVRPSARESYSVADRCRRANEAMEEEIARILNK